MTHEYEILWLSPFENKTIDDPPIKAQQIFETDGLFYRKLSLDRPVWNDDFSTLLNRYFPDLLVYLKEDTYNYKFEVKLEFNDAESLWVYALYIQFDSVPELVHFMIWFKSQNYGN